MAIINYTNQLKFTGSGPLDVKNTPVRTYSELPSVPAQRYVGMEVTVLNQGVQKCTRLGAAREAEAVRLRCRGAPLLPRCVLNLNAFIKIMIAQPCGERRVRGY